MNEENKVYWVKAKLWTEVDVLHPVSAESPEHAKEEFLKAAEGKAKDIIIEDVVEDIEGYLEDLEDTEEPTTH